MDMSAGFAAATAQAAPQAAIVHARFHVSRRRNVAVDQVRRRQLPEIPGVQFAQ
jgi:transposase